jgi:hypothetical protein
MVVVEETVDLGLPGGPSIGSGSGVPEGGRSMAAGRGWAVIMMEDGTRV